MPHRWGAGGRGDRRRAEDLRAGAACCPSSAPRAPALSMPALVSRRGGGLLERHHEIRDNAITGAPGSNLIVDQRSEEVSQRGETHTLISLWRRMHQQKLVRPVTHAVASVNEAAAGTVAPTEARLQHRAVPRQELVDRDFRFPVADEDALRHPQLVRPVAPPAIPSGVGQGRAGVSRERLVQAQLAILHESLAKGPAT